MMFIGSIIIASFGVAGILSAIAATSPRNDNEEAAVGYLIGTSVSYCLTSSLSYPALPCFT